VNAVISIVVFVGAGMTQPRMVGWAESGHPILGAAVIGNCALFALARGLAETRYRVVLYFATALLLAFIVLTGSRGPLGAVLAAGLVLFAGRSWRWLLVALLSAGLAILLLHLAAPAALDHLANDLLARGTSHRLDIWHYTLARIAERPWFGWGQAAYLDMPEFTFPHSLYLSVLFYSGGVGFGLLLALIVGISVGLFRKPDVADRRLLLALWVNALLAGITDLGQVANGPGPLWYIFWLPIVLNIDVLGRSNPSAPPVAPLVVSPAAPAPHTAGPVREARQSGAG
jgi:O-antigen ligase